ncbi:MAG: 5-dehydro-4-deoxy-D-glucuronate isomerase [Chitinophagaceae bacterium]|nr:5-dehydro-4-deoxy-D-glucuronate isomerase [Chitinophagaceae bacterium]
MPTLHTLPVIHAVHPSQYPNFATENLRSLFLLTDLKKTDIPNLTYTHYDRLIAGTVIPVAKEVVLPTYENLKSSFFLERRELGIINVGGSGMVKVDGHSFDLEKYDCVYAGMGSKEVTFKSNDAANPAIFYLLSSPAHATHPTRLMKGSEASPITLGSQATSNERTIYKYIHLEGVQSCQLVMGLTVLKTGSVWNTMPSHLHDRRSEIYFYFDVAEDQRVMHFMGGSTETKNMVVANHEAVLSPAWSIHSGCGTASYSFIWGMAGENKDYADIDPLPAATLL